MMLMIAYMYKGPQGTENSYGKFGSLVTITMINIIIMIIL